MGAIRSWAEEHMGDISRARERYDARAAEPVDPL
jgi:hypothetical protein